MSSLVEFILERLDEDEATARATLDYYDPLDWDIQPFGQHGAWHMDGPVDGPSGYGALIVDPARVLAEVNAKRAILEWHKNWPVLVETPPEVEAVDSADPSSFAFRASQQIAWMTEREYVARFGTEPPTSPILRLLASVWVDAPGFREEWRP